MCASVCVSGAGVREVVPQDFQYYFIGFFPCYLTEKVTGQFGRSQTVPEGNKGVWIKMVMWAGSYRRIFFFFFFKD